MSYNDPIVYIPPNPKGLDFAISKIQNSLSSIDFLSKIFGRAWEIDDYRGDDKRLVTGSQGVRPKAFASSNINGKDGNYYTLLPNDNLTSYCFFVPESRENIEHGKLASRDMSLIFWGNLHKIDSSKKHPFLEEIKEQFYDVFELIGSIDVHGYTDITSEVWDGFDWTSNDNKNSRYPNMGFRIYFNLSYDEKTC
jgi:hypothetical protein